MYKQVEQVDGMAIGSPLELVLSETFMVELERTLILTLNRHLNNLGTVLFMVHVVSLIANL